LMYWKQRFKEQPITDICSIINTNTGDKDTGKIELLIKFN